MELPSCHLLTIRRYTNSIFIITRNKHVESTKERGNVCISYMITHV